MPNSASVIESAMMLREQAPEQWNRFVAEMRGYATQVAEDMVRCDPALLPRGQGLAIQANEIATMLEQAPKLYEQMRNLREKLRHGQQASIR
jgi:hypothetical protein